MSLRHRRARPSIATAAILLSLARAGSSAAVDWSHAESTVGYVEADAEALAALAPGQVIGWLLATGEVGRGTVAVADDSSLVTDGGLLLDQTTCLALWRPHRSRGNMVGRGLGYGLAVGAIAGSAAYANWQNDAATGLENLGAGLGVPAAIVFGLLGGLIVGVAAPRVDHWELIYLAPGAGSANVDRLPSPDGSPRPVWPRQAWFELTGGIGDVSWYGDSAAEEHGSLRAAVWLPAVPRLDLGAAVFLGPDSTVDGSSDHSVAVLARFGGRTGAVQPYLTTGLGWYGLLGGTFGFSFGGGLRAPLGRRWALSLEAGSVTGFATVNEDRPGQATIGIGLARSLGSDGDRR